MKKNDQNEDKVFGNLMAVKQYSDEKRDEAIKLAKSGKFVVEENSIFFVPENTRLNVNSPLNVVKERPIFRSTQTPKSEMSLNDRTKRMLIQKYKSLSLILSS